MQWTRSLAISVADSNIVTCVLDSLVSTLSVLNCSNRYEQSARVLLRWYKTQNCPRHVLFVGLKRPWSGHHHAMSQFCHTIYSVRGIGPDSDHCVWPRTCYCIRSKRTPLPSIKTCIDHSSCFEALERIAWFCYTRWLLLTLEVRSEMESSRPANGVLGFGLESKIATSTSDLAQLSCVAIFHSMTECFKNVTELTLRNWKMSTIKFWHSGWLIFVLVAHLVVLEN